jgi:hypothetical protein
MRSRSDFAPDSEERRKTLAKERWTMLNQNLSKPTRAIQQGKRDLEAFGRRIHRDLLSRDEIKVLPYRLNEQARLEREKGVSSQ